MTWGCPLLLELGALGFVRFVRKRRLHTVASMTARRPPGPGSEDGWDLGGEGSGPFLAVSEPGCAQHSPSGGGSAGRCWQGHWPLYSGTWLAQCPSQAEGILCYISGSGGAEDTGKESRGEERL